MSDKIDVVENTQEREPTEEEIREMVNEEIDVQGGLLGDVAMRMSSFNPDLASMSLASALLDVALSNDLDIHSLLDFIDRGFHESLSDEELNVSDEVKEKDISGN